MVLHRADRAAHDQLRSRQPDRRRLRVSIACCRSPASTPGWSSSATPNGSAARSSRPSSRAPTTCTIPYRNQSTYPNFDTAHRRLQLLAPVHRQPLPRQRPHRRREPADRCAVGSRFLDPRRAARKMRFAIGQQYYFKSQQVTLNEPPRTSNTSDLLVAGEARLSDVWTAAGALQYQVNPKQTERFDLGGALSAGAPARCSTSAIATSASTSTRADRFRSSSRSTCRARFRSSTTGRRSAAGTTRWSTPRRWRACLGFEYNGGCWVFRIAAQRLQTNTQQVTTVGIRPARAQRPRAPWHQSGRRPPTQRPRLFDGERSGAAADRRQGGQFLPEFLGSEDDVGARSRFDSRPRSC